jgi:hypothetical protein
MCYNCFTNALSSDYLKGLPTIFKKAMQDLHRGKITAEDLHGGLMQHIATELWRGVSIGFDTSYENHDPESDHFRLIRDFEENVFIFSGFKTYQQLREASLLLFDEKKQIRPFTEFFKDVLNINQNYNVNYLRAEYDNAVVSAQMATKWESFEDDAILKFRATIDDHTTVICHSLNGLTKPKSWPGWKKYWLPLHWGERSNIIETTDEPDDIAESDLDNPPAIFSGNVALDGVIFPDTHPYFDVCSGKTRVVKNGLCQILKNKIKSTSKKIYRKYIYSLPIEKQFIFISKNIQLHRLRPVNKSDYQDVLNCAKYHADKGKKVKILPDLHVSETKLRKILMPNAKGNTNADLLVENTIYEVESTAKYKNITNAIKRGFAQSNHLDIVFISDTEVLEYEEAANNIFNVKKKYKDLEELNIFNKNGKLLFSKKRDK